jgi:hypothetical protein
VLDEFFELSDEGYRNFRADNEISDYRKFIDKQKVNGSKGGRPKKSQRKPTANPDQSQNNPNQQPLTTNQQPVVKATKGSRLSTDFVLPEDWIAFCQQERPDLNPQKVFDGFKDYWVAKAGSTGLAACLGHMTHLSSNEATVGTPIRLRNGSGSLRHRSRGRK